MSDSMNRPRTTLLPRRVSVHVAAWLFVLACCVPSPAGTRLRIYIVTDLEGASGVYKFAQTREPGNPLGEPAKEYLMGDIAAVVRGLRAGGATDIVVLDGHGSQAFVPHLMEPGAKYVTGWPRTDETGWSLDKSFSGVVMFGFHAMMGTPDGVLNHTQNSKMEKRFWYNGVESGELAQSAIEAGFFDVPPILVTGDVATCREARKFFGDGIVTVATKQGISREAAVLYPFEETRKALYEGAKKAMAAIPKCKPYKIKVPVKVKYQYLDLNTGQAKPPVITKEWVSDDGKSLLGPPKQ